MSESIKVAEKNIVMKRVVIDMTLADAESLTKFLGGLTYHHVATELYSALSAFLGPDYDEDADE